MADGKKAEDRLFEDVCAELGNSAMAVYGTACYLAKRHAPEMLDSLQAEMERYRRLVGKLNTMYFAK